jgi:hypothetical protein
MFLINHANYTWDGRKPYSLKRVAIFQIRSLRFSALFSACRCRKTAAHFCATCCSAARCLAARASAILAHARANWRNSPQQGRDPAPSSVTRNRSFASLGVNRWKARRKQDVGIVAANCVGELFVSGDGFGRRLGPHQISRTAHDTGAGNLHGVFVQGMCSRSADGSSRQGFRCGLFSRDGEAVLAPCDEACPGREMQALQRRISCSPFCRSAMKPPFSKSAARSLARKPPLNGSRATCCRERHRRKRESGDEHRREPQHRIPSVAMLAGRKKGRGSRVKRRSQTRPSGPARLVICVGRSPD